MKEFKIDKVVWFAIEPFGKGNKKELIALRKAYISGIYVHTYSHKCVCIGYNAVAQSKHPQTGENFNNKSLSNIELCDWSAFLYKKQ